MWLGSWPEVEGGGSLQGGLVYLSQPNYRSAPNQKSESPGETESPCMSFHLTLKGIHEGLRPTDSGW